MLEDKSLFLHIFILESTLEPRSIARLDAFRTYAPVIQEPGMMSLKPRDSIKLLLSQHLFLGSFPYYYSFCVLLHLLVHKVDEYLGTSDKNVVDWDVDWAPC